MSERFVVAGLAHARSPWLPRLAQWATGGGISVELVQCLSPSELRARVAGSRAHSAALIDADLPGIDRDLVGALADAGVATLLVVRPGSSEGRWRDLGAAGVLPPDFSAHDLVSMLTTHARPLSAVPDAAPVLVPGSETPDGSAGRLVAVVGPGGTGASVLAAAAASGVAGGRVLLADLALRADQAMLHHTRDVVPGVQELVDAHRTADLDPEAVDALTFDVARPYRLLLGLRRVRDWTALRPRAFERALQSLLAAHDVVVADVDPQVDGEADTGSADVEDRHLMARTTLRRADLVVAVGGPSMQGVHALSRLLGDLADLGVDLARVLPVVNQAPRHPAGRAERAAALVALCGATPGVESLPSPLFVPPVRQLEAALRDAAPLPTGLVRPIAGAVDALLDRLGAAPTAGQEPVAVRPGSVGSWGDDEAVA